MKITGGYLKGRKIKTIKGLDIRPTSEKLRQAFFNIVQCYFEDYTFVDLCSGTGIMSFEAVSRGLKNAYLVDNSMKSNKMVNENIKLLDLSEKCTVISDNILNYLKLRRIPVSEKLIIYLDPPYDSEKLYKKTMISMDKVKFQDSVIFAVEHSSRLKLQLLENIPVWKIKKYGDKSITLFATFNNVC